MKKIIILILTFFVVSPNLAQKYWDVSSDREITWRLNENNFPHNDFIESSGRFISVISYYNIDENRHFNISRRCIFPVLRIKPNDTHSSYSREVDIDIMKLINVRGGWSGCEYKSLKNSVVDSVKIRGYLEVYSKVDGLFSVKSKYYPSTDKPLWCENYTIKNISNKKQYIDIPEIDILSTSRPQEGVDDEIYEFCIKSVGNGFYELEKGESLVFGVEIQAKEKESTFVNVNLQKEFEAREKYLEEMSNHLILKTPDSVLNTMFEFAKVRSTESIFETSGGLMHAPGGGNFYAAIWTNDQAEYVNPFFSYLGYKTGAESAINSYRHFAKFMNDEYTPIPSSIIAEGKDIWNGAGDRGDSAMIAYGASRFALQYGDKNIAKELWKLIEWCLEYNRRNLNEQGVVLSDSDELEGRFPSGKANLCTSSLYYDALISASYLAKELGVSPSNNYMKEAKVLRKNINDYFASNVEGYETYKYYEGNDVLRAWICIPLTVGITERTEETIDALFSPRLWTSDGLATKAGEITFWDRSTLYALRGVFYAGYQDRALPYLKQYSSRRLLGDHVPYAVEAYPEGGQAQLSAESGLYCRLYVEGLFGLRPTGLKSFDLTPRIPEEWNNISLSSISAFGGVFSIFVERYGDKLKVFIKDENGKIIIKKIIKNGSTFSVNFK